MLIIISIITTPLRAYETHDILNINHINQNNDENIPDSNVCQIHAQRAEVQYKIKNNLLQTIAVVESGRWSDSTQYKTSWPWTVHANGKGYYYPSKQAAITAVEKMQKQGIKSIDVGCMQINLKYHGSAFESLEQAFDPKENIKYGASFLNLLHKRNLDNWAETAMDYHSKKPSYGQKYKTRLEYHYAQYIASDNQSNLF